MKRFFRYGLVAVLLPALFVACTGVRRTTSNIEWQEGEQVAVAFLGYYDSFAAFRSAPSYVRLSRTFPQLVEAAEVEAGLGRELYLVLPRTPETSVAVLGEGALVSEDGSREFWRAAGTPLLVHCNFYEPNCRVVCGDGAGDPVGFLLQVDPGSGALVLPAAGAHDISLPVPAPMEGYTAFDYGTDFEDRDLGIRLRLEAGKPVLTIAAAPLAALGYDADSFRLSDGDNPFSGINGLCKGVFLGTIGQDYNPVACVVMENGDIKKCSVFYAMQQGEPELSGALPGFKDVVGFENGVGGDFEYATIYAVDARGGSTEIPHFNDYCLFLAQDGGASVEATLSPDWRFYVNRISEDGAFEIYNGTFSLTDRRAGEDRFQYRLEQYARQEGDEFQTVKRTGKGSFTARDVDGSFEVRLTGTDVFRSGTLFRDARLVGTDEGIEYD